VIESYKLGVNAMCEAVDFDNSRSRNRPGHVLDAVNQAPYKWILLHEQMAKKINRRNRGKCHGFHNLMSTMSKEADSSNGGVNE